MGLRLFDIEIHIVSFGNGRRITGITLIEEIYGIVWAKTTKLARV